MMYSDPTVFDGLSFHARIFGIGTDVFVRTADNISNLPHTNIVSRTVLYRRDLRIGCQPWWTSNPRWEPRNYTVP